VRARGIDRVEQPPHGIGRVGGSLEQPAFYIKGRRGVGAGARGALGVELDLLSRITGLETGEQFRPVDPGALSQVDEGIVWLRERRPVVLLAIEQVMGRLEPPLARRAHGHLGGRDRVRVDARQRQIDEYPPHLPRSDILAIQRREHRHREHAAGRALEIGHLVDGYRGFSPPLGPGRQGVGVGLECNHDHQGDWEQSFHATQNTKKRQSCGPMNWRPVFTG